MVPQHRLAKPGRKACTPGKVFKPLGARSGSCGEEGQYSMQNSANKITGFSFSLNLPYITPNLICSLRPFVGALHLHPEHLTGDAAIVEIVPILKIDTLYVRLYLCLHLLGQLDELHADEAVIN